MEMSKFGDKVPRKSKSVLISRVPSPSDLLAYLRATLRSNEAQSIVLTNLCIFKKFDKWLPHERTQVHKDLRVVCCRLSLQYYSKSYSILQRIITVNESWVKFGPVKDGFQPCGSHRTLPDTTRLMLLPIIWPNIK